MLFGLFYELFEGVFALYDQYKDTCFDSMWNLLPKFTHILIGVLC